MGKFNRFLCILLVVALLSGCGASQTAPETSAATQPVAAVHLCGSPCPECGLCTDSTCTEPACSEKCSGHAVPTQAAALEAPSFPDREADFITTEAVSLDLGTFVYDIQPGIWVPGHIYRTAPAAAAAMEKVSGLSFAGNSGYNTTFPDGKVHASFSRDMLYAGQDWYQGLPTSEVGSAYASSFFHAELSPGDLLGHDGAVIHELGHVLSYRQTSWTFCQLLCEGFTEYTSFLTARELAATDPLSGFYGVYDQNILINMTIFDYDALYRQPLEYWFENTFEYSANANYCIGFRFMAYLQDVYGDYSRWITEYEKAHSFLTSNTTTDQPPIQEQIQVLKDSYGEEVLDNFYPWLQEREEDFEEDTSAYRDLTGIEVLAIYPYFNAIESPTALVRFRYQDLTVDLEPAKAYLTQYKDVDMSNAQLQVSAPVQAEIIDAQGNATAVTLQGSIPLEGISAIRLTGSGTLDFLKITGYDHCG